MKGFTLLELLLVILIIGVLAVFGLLTYQQYSTNAKITNTAQQMQTLLQAAGSYYVDYGCWPDTSRSTKCPPQLPMQSPNQCTDATLPSFDTYISLGSGKNPWGYPYTCQPAPLGNKFQVLSGILPQSAFINRITALLPGAGQNLNKPDQVQAEITIPKKVQNIASNYIIAAIGNTGLISDGSTATFSFSCPPGWQHDAIAIPSHIEASKYSTCMAGSRTFEILYAPVYCTQRTGTNNTFDCRFTNSFSGQAMYWLYACLKAHQESAGDVDYFYMGWCYNPQKKRAKSPLLHFF